MAAYYDITTNKGSGFYHHFKITDENNNPINLSASDVKLSVKKSPLGNDVVLDFSTSGITVYYQGSTGQTFSQFSATGGIDVNTSYLGISGDTGGIYVYAPANIMEKVEIGNWTYSLAVQFGITQFNAYNVDFNTNVAVYGEAKASSLLKSVNNGEDSLDVVLIGDSNTGFGQYGWHEGIIKACVETQGMTVYATPLAPFVGPLLNSSGEIGYRTAYSSIPIRNSGDPVAPGSAYSFGQSSGQTFGLMYDGFLRGNTDSNSATLRQKFNVGICSGDTADSYDYISNNAFWGFAFSDSTGSLNNFYYSHVHGGIGIKENHPFRGLTFTYRVVHSRGINGGKMTMNIRRDEPPYIDIASPLTIDTNNGESWDWYVSELSNSNSGNTGELRCSSLGLSNEERGVTGNVGLLFHSVYRKTKGIAFNNLMYMGGRTCKRLANTLNATPIDTLATYLKELKNRQITAGGSGKILFLVQCGTNDIVEPETTTENFLTNMRSIINRLDIACYAASISKDNFGFIVMVSHPMNSTDTDVVTQSNSMTAYREIIAERSESNVLNLPVTSMNLLALKGTFNSTYDRLNDQQLYGSSNTDFMHLSSAGYDELGIPIIQNLLNYVPASRPPDYGIDITNGDKQNIVNGRFAVEWSNV